MWGRVYQEVDTFKIRDMHMSGFNIALFPETSIHFTSFHPVGVGTGILVGN